MNEDATGPGLEALRARIAGAFASRPYPGDDRLANAKPGCAWYEGTIAAEFLCGRDWRALTFAQILHGYDAPHMALMSFMQPAGFAYFLPGFLLMALDLADTGRSGERDALFTFADSLCFHLTRPSPNSLSEQYELVKDIDGVPDEIKESLKNPTPEAKRAERRLVERHDELVAMLRPAERSAVCAGLEALAALLGEAPNPAHDALRTRWARYAA